MKTNHKQCTIKEYQFIGFHDKDEICQIDKGKLVPKKVYDAINSFVLNGSEDDGTYFLVPGYRKSVGNVLLAKNYVGVIETKDGTVVEILPKIYGMEDKDDKEQRKVFLRMLRCLKDSPFKKFNFANLKSTDMHLLEIFISMFLAELSDLIRAGLKRNYVPFEENSGVVKGKILWSQNIKHNYAHKERTYISHDEYMEDIPENRIIKSALLFLKNRSKNSSNQKSIMEHLFIFDSVNQPKNFEADLSKCG